MHILKMTDKDKQWGHHKKTQFQGNSSSLDECGLRDYSPSLPCHLTPLFLFTTGKKHYAFKYIFIMKCQVVGSQLERTSYPAEWPSALECLLILSSLKEELPRRNKEFRKLLKESYQLCSSLRLLLLTAVKRADQRKGGGADVDSLPLKVI